jgi:ATP-dependent helicase/nuclease subunit A
MSLSERQDNAAHRLGQDVCVVAGPGSGKTSVLIERFTWLVSERGVDPGRILAITFTDKAATEIKERMVRAFEHAPAIREQIERAYVSTIHAFCARLLRENAIIAAIDPQFQVLEQPGKLLRQVADDALEGIYNEQPDRMRRFLRSLAVSERESQWVPDLASSLIAIYQAMRMAGSDFRAARLAKAPVPYELLRNLVNAVLNEGLLPKKEVHADYLDWCREVLAMPLTASTKWFELLSRCDYNKTYLPMRSVARETQIAVREASAVLRSHLLVEYYANERELIIESLERIDATYRLRKRQQSALDFDDLEEFAIRLLESEHELSHRVQSGFDHILMDELQDTNPLQWKLLSLIRRPDAFFAVGDINQSIFGFRHAEPELFAAYRSELEREGKAIDELRANYRSRPELLEIVNHTFAGPEPGIEAHELTSGRDDFTREQEPVTDLSVFTGENTEAAERIESLWVARRICELIGRFQYRDIAILTRANMALGELQRALDDYHIPSIVLGGMTFYETREVRDLILLLTVLVNPHDEVALAGLLRSPLFGVSDEDLLLFAKAGSLYDGVRQRQPAHWHVIDELREIRNCVSPDQLLRRVLDDCDYESGLSARGRANVEKFMAALRGRHRAEPGPLSDALDFIRDASPEAEAPPADFGDAVRLMTIHKSKGLEFPVVFLPFLHRDRGTGMPVIGYTHANGLGVKWRDPATRKGVADFTYEANESLAQRTQAGEENRLLYVGMTRAKRHMVLSYSVTPKRKGGPWAQLLARRLFDPADARVRIMTADLAPELIHAPPPDAVLPTNVYIDKTPRQDQRDSTASITDISVFAQCPRKYFLSRYIGWDAGSRSFVDIEESEPRPDRGELDASEVGTQVHAILAGLHVESPVPDAVDLADRFRTSQLAKRALRASRKQHEHDFVISIEGLVLRGQIDLWFEHNRDIVLIDYKTDQVRRPIDPRRVHAYALQLQLYAIALQQIAGKPVTHAYLHFLRPDELIEVDLSPLQLNSAREYVRSFLAAQSNLEYPLNPGDHCLRCEYYKDVCPARRSLAIAVSRS